jgi:hypothetical protein
MDIVLKNSNTGEIVMKQHFSGISFKSPDIFLIDWNNKSIDTPDLKGFVEISEKPNLIKKLS